MLDGKTYNVLASVSVVDPGIDVAVIIDIHDITTIALI